METSEVILIALVVLAPAALLWGLFLARSGRAPGRGVRIGIPRALRPGRPDEVLEGPRIETLMIGGVLTTIALAVFIPFYWLPEADRQAHFEERFSEEGVERGKLIYSVPPELEEDADPSAFKEEEKAIALGQGCANCHGSPEASDPELIAAGGLANPAYTDPQTGKVVGYRAPPLNNVFQRWDEEIVRFTIERGRPGTPMPAWGVEYGGSMTDQMIDDVIAWLRTLPGNQRPPEISESCQDPAAGDTQCGQEIFEARCAVCHGEQGQGKDAKGTQDDPWYQGMALWQGDVRHLSRAQHVTTVVNGRRFAFMPAFGEAPAQGIPIPPYPLTESQIDAVVEYERGL